MRTLRFSSFLFAFFCCVVAHAQEWQAHYQAALKFYQQEEFGKAIPEAEKAIALASADAKGAAFSRQIFTASCLAEEQYEKGLAQISAEIENFRALEPNGDNFLEALHKKGQLQMGVARFEDAAKSFGELVALHAQRSGKESYEYLVSLAEQGDALMQAKKYREAQQAYEQCIAGLRGIPDAGEDYLYALFNSAYIDFTTSNKPDASKKLSQLVAFMEKNSLTSYSQYEEARRMLSSLNVSGEVASTGLILPVDRVRQLFETAFALQDENFTEALKNYQACASVIAEHNLVNNTTFSCYLNYARLLFAMGSYPEAESMLASAQQHAAKLFPEASAERGHVQILAGDLALHGGDVNTALSLYEPGIKNLKQEKAATWIKQARWVGEQLIAANAGEGAIKVLGIVLKDPAYASFDARDKIILHQLNGRAHLESRMAEKLIHYLKPLADAERNSDLKQAYFLLLGQATNEKGNLKDALQWFLNGITLAPGGIVAGELYYESARAHQQSGDYRQAEIHYHKALELIVNSPSSETVVPLLFNSLATFYIQLGNYDAAERFFLNLLSQENTSSLFYNAVRQNLSALYQQTGRYQEAKELLIETLHADARWGTDHPDYAIALQNLAAVYQSLNQLDSARLLYEKALAIDEKQFGEQSLSFATKLANLGAVYQEANDFESARRMFERALAIRKNLLASDHPDLAYSQYGLANLLYRTQKPREALPLFKASADFYIRQIHDVFPALSDYERTAFYNRVSEVISSYQMFILENINLDKSFPATLLNFRLQTKAILLNSSLKVRNQILRSGDQTLIRDFHVWQHTKEQLAYLFSLTKAEREQHADLVDEYTRQANDLEKSLSLRSESFSKAFVPADGDWRKIQASLKPGEGAVEILRVKLKGRDSVVYAALVVKPGLEQPSVVVMPDGNYLEQKGFRSYINRIRFKLEDDVSYNAFWKKLEPAVRDLHTIYLSPDGVYAKINALTLYDPATKEYIIDRHKVMLVSNPGDLLNRSTQTTGSPSAMLVGFPDYRMNAAKGLGDLHSSSDANTSFFSSIFKSSFAELPGTGKEIAQVGEFLASRDWKVQSYVRNEALEEKIKEAQAVTLLHIATHGFFVAPKDEHAKQVYSNKLGDINNNSMLRSGLILAGAEKNLVAMLSGTGGSQVEDGILTAYEVMNLNLDQADLVVLSACETGTGDVKNGEGVYGLQRAFLLAGARHLLMSLWKVDDAATQELMAAFYREWLGGKEKLAAFHDAQKSMKEKFPHPNFWGAFVMMGR